MHEPGATDAISHKVDRDAPFPHEADVTSVRAALRSPRRLRIAGTIIIDLSKSHIWDASTVATLDAITQKYAAKGETVTVTVTGLNASSQDRHDRLAGSLSGGH